MPVNIPFIPQEGITNGILSAIQMANQQHAQQQTNAIQQQNAQTAASEAQTAASRLTAEQPEIAARTANLGANTQLTQASLAQRQQTMAFLRGDESSPSVDPTHVDQLTTQIAGPHAQAPVTPPVAQAASADATPTATIPAQSGPTVSAKKAHGFDAYLQALDSKVNFLPEEKNSIEAARQLAAVQGTPEAVADLQKNVESIVAKRGDPSYARYVALRQQGLSADDAHQKIAQIDSRNAALTKFETDPGELGLEKAPDAVLQLKSMLSKATDTEKPRIQSALTTAQLAVKTNLDLDAAKKRAEKAAQDGDPNAAGKLLADGDAAPNEITTGRNSAFAVAAFNAAKKLKPGWSASTAQAEFDQAKSPTNLGFFGSAKSLTDPGGTLDQLATQGKRLKNTDIQVVNSVDNAVKLATGSGPQAHYAATVLGVSDDLAKVLGGGTGTDSSRAEAKALVNSALSQGQREEAIEGIRDAVNSQMASRIGTNSVMQRTFGAGVKGVNSGPSGGGYKVGDIITQNGHTYTVKAVSNGKVTDAE